MAQPYAARLADSSSQMQQSLWRRLFSGWDKESGNNGPGDQPQNGQGAEQHDDAKAGLTRRGTRKVVPGLPRAQTFKRQCSEVRSRLEPVRPTPAERRAVSMDRRVHGSNSALKHTDPRTSAPDFLHHCFSAAPSPPSFPMSPRGGMLDSLGDLYGFDLDKDSTHDGAVHDSDTLSKIEVQSMTTSQYDALIDSELERRWILNLSMHFRDKSKREKFFVTYRQHEHLWRRVTISLDYRNAPENSLEADLARTQYQRDKSAKIYEAIRDSLAEIDFYNTVTNLKLETRDGRLHVHVVEDVNEIINYPPVRMIQHMNCRRVKEREIHFDSHMSGFVYKVRVHGRALIKKEIPGPDTVDEFLYEINALHQLYRAKNVIQFYGIVVDDREEHVTGLLISYAARGALIDIIYDNDHSLPWSTREKWARQIVCGLSEIHEAGFVQGDFTLSNIVIDESDDAKIIDINRRGCPIGWEPPEVTPLIESNQRISMYIGVKSDLYQLGMVLWALATQEDEPEAYGRPLKIDPDIQVPAWYRRVVDTCLSVYPQNRAQAIQLLSWFPDSGEGSQYGRPNGSSVSLNGDGNSHRDYISPSGIPRTTTLHPPSEWAYVGWGSQYLADEPLYYPSRGRSPPSPMPSNQGDYESSRYGHRMYTWSDTYNRAPVVPSVSDILDRDPGGGSDAKLRGSEETLDTYADGPRGPRRTATEKKGDGGRDTQGAEHDQMDGGPTPTTSWGLPPKRWSLAERRHVEGGEGGEGGDNQPRDPGNRGNTGPESRADSGKDVTDRASTPRDRQEGIGLPENTSTSSFTDSSPRRGQALDALTATTGALTHDRSYDSDSNDHGHDEGEDEHEQGTLHPSPSVDSDPRAGPGRAAQDLKGVGSAYEPLRSAHDDGHDEKRLREMVIDEDLNSELDRSLKRVLATDDRRS